jgi:hypothetical protein
LRAKHPQNGWLADGTDQLPLDPKREATALPIAQDTTVLLQAPADLLLGALGEPIKEPASATHDAGGGDESEDHV